MTDRHPATPPDAVDVVDFLRAQLPTWRDLVPGLVRGSEFVLLRAAPMEAGTAALRGLALARAAGAPWMGCGVSPGRTLLLSPGRGGRLQAKLRGLAAALERPPAAGQLFALVTRALKLDRPEGRAALLAHVERLAVDLVCVDAAARFVADEAFSGLVAVLDELVERGVTVAASCRAGGAAASALHPAADVVLTLEATSPGAALLTAWRPQMPREAEVQIALKLERGWFRRLPTARLVEHPAPQQAAPAPKAGG